MKLTYETIIEAQKLMAKKTPNSVMTAIVPDELYGAYYFSRRYDNIHRLITHCNHIPNRFKSGGILYITNKETRL